jgi:hypothetical protein
LTAYRRLIARIRDAGFRAESYQFPLVLADRSAGGSLWQRIAGGLDVAVDREVVMLYTSLLGRPGPGLVERLAPTVRAVGLGSTGGGIDHLPKLTWAQLERDLLLASAACTDLSIFSLEGCVEQGFLQRLRDFDYARRADAPMSSRLSGRFLSGMCTGLSLVGRAL